MTAKLESVRNGRRANFYIVENLLIDHYLRIVGATAFAVYCCLVRHADDHRTTFVGTAKLADESNLSQRQVRRILKLLEGHGLLRIECTRKPVRKTVYWVLPVPPPGKAASAPLFDQWLPPEQGTWVSAPGDVGVRAGDMGVRRNKEEQDPLNKRGGPVEDRSSESQPPPSSSDLENQTATLPEDPYQLAAGMMEALGIPGGRPLLEAIHDSISMRSKLKGTSRAAAFNFILPRALDAQKRGELTKPLFWFRDAGYEPKKSSKTDVAPRSAAGQILEQERQYGLAANAGGRS